MTYKPEKWPIENVRELVHKVGSQGFADEPWRIAAAKQAAVGDTAILFKQGENPRGIFGVGTITGAPRLDKAESPNPDKPQYFAPVRWTRLVDPTESFLLPFLELEPIVPTTLINAHASGTTVPPSVASAVLALLAARKDPRSMGSNSFDPTSVEDGRQKIIAAIRRRQGQGAFRRALLVAFNGRCALTGCSVEAVLEAAHIFPYRGAQTNHVTNSLLLRADLHTLFDLGLIAIETNGMTVLVSPLLAGSAYKQLAGRNLRLPHSPGQRPNAAALDLHRQNIFQAHAAESAHVGQSVTVFSVEAR